MISVLKYLVISQFQSFQLKKKNRIVFVSTLTSATVCVITLFKNGSSMTCIHVFPFCGKTELLF